MKPAEFRTLLGRSGLTQTELVGLGGLSLTAVNRYCSRAAKDRTSVPRTVVALVAAWGLMTDRQQATLRQRLQDLESQMMVVVWCFHRHWAMRGPTGSIAGWTHDVAAAGRWPRDEAPQEFGTMLVEDPHWPTQPGAEPIYPRPPARPPRTPRKPRVKARRGVMVLSDAAD